MKFERHFLALTCRIIMASAAFGAFTSTSRANESAKAEMDFAALKQMFDVTMKGGPEELKTEEEQLAWYRAEANIICDSALIFVQEHPQDVHRWEAIVYFLRRAPYDLDKQARAVRIAKGHQLANEALAATNLPEEQGQEIAFWDYDLTSREIHIFQSETGHEADLSPVRAALGRLASLYPQAAKLRIAEGGYVNLLKERSVVEAAAWLQTLTHSPNAAVSGYASGQLRVMKMKERPVEMRFTAIDGREVDLSKLRGKVILVDFWATWCAPCKEELPNLKTVYNKYHIQGFEVIGISLDKPEDLEVLRKFVKEHYLPWPQFHDEENPRNHLALEFGVIGIPATFLFNAQGKLASENARGPELEKLVRSELHLD